MLNIVKPLILNVNDSSLPRLPINEKTDKVMAMYKRYINMRFLPLILIFLFFL